MSKKRLLFITTFALVLFSQSLLARQEGLTISGKSKGKIMRLFASNPDNFPYTLTVRLAFDHMEPIGQIPEVVVIPPTTDSTVIASLIMTDFEKATLTWDKSTYALGDINARHNDRYIYTLPFEKGDSYLLSQGYQGRFSHKDQNALDFDMKEGTGIIAARGGKVIITRSDSETGCITSDCASFANFIIIQHDDGTMATYSHLMKDGVSIKVGDTVRAGQLIGYSGNTGWSRSPHLHFEVFKATETIETKFLISKKKTGLLEPGKRYRSR